jgi:hypothetical protein
MDNVFSVNPTVNVLYVFPNENAFISKRDADNYATQMNLKYEIVERKEKEVKSKKEK